MKKQKQKTTSILLRFSPDQKIASRDRQYFEQAFAVSGFKNKAVFLRSIVNRSVLDLLRRKKGLVILDGGKKVGAKK